MKFCRASITLKEKKIEGGENLDNKGIGVPMLAVVVIVIAIVVGTSAYLVTQTPGEKPPEKKFYGLSTKIVHNVWEGLFEETFMWYCGDHEWAYNTLQARGDPVLQNTHIRRLVDMGVDGIVVAAQDADVSAEGAKYAADHGVPVFTTDADINSEHVVMYVGYSGVRASRLLGEKIVEYLKDEVEPIGEVQGSVLEIRGPLGGASAEDRHNGFMEVINEYPDITVETVVGEFQREPALTAALPKVTARDFDVLYTGNGPMCMGGIEAIEKVGRVDVREMFVLTIDAMPAVITAIKEDKIDYAFDQPCPWYNVIALYYMNKYIEEGPGAMPAVGTMIESLPIDPQEHVGVTWWETQVWAPAEITTQFGHLWFQTVGVLVDKSNADDMTLWANAKLPGW